MALDTSSDFGNPEPYSQAMESRTSNPASSTAQPASAAAQAADSSVPPTTEASLVPSANSTDLTGCVN